MKNLKSNILLSALFATSALLATASQANDTAKMQQAYKSTNVKAALVNVCKEDIAKSKKLTDTEVSKYCSCAVEADGRLTNDQKWQIQSAINQKKSPSTLPFMKKQHEELQACFGSSLTTKLEKITEDAIRAQQQAKK